MNLPKRKSKVQLQREIDDFNTNYRIGDTVNLKLDSGEAKEVKVKSPAIILGGHSTVCWFEGIIGCYALSSIIK